MVTFRYINRQGSRHFALHLTFSNVFWENVVLSDINTVLELFTGLEISISVIQSRKGKKSYRKYRHEFLSSSS